MHMDWHTPPSLPETLTIHPRLLATLTSHLLSFHMLVLAQLPQMCSHPTHPVDTHALVCTLMPTRPLHLSPRSSPPQVLHYLNT